MAEDLCVESWGDAGSSWAVARISKLSSAAAVNLNVVIWHLSHFPITTAGENGRTLNNDDSGSDDSDTDEDLEELFADGLSEILHEEL